MYRVLMVLVLCSKEGEYEEFVGALVRECVMNRAVRADKCKESGIETCRRAMPWFHTLTPDVLY